MSKVERHAQFSRLSADAICAGLKIPKGTQIATSEPAIETITLLDAFDADVAQAGYLLIRTERSLQLLGEECVLEQSASQHGVPAQMPDGEVTHLLRTIVSARRALMTVAEGNALHQSIAILDDEHKTLVRGEIWEIRVGNHTPISFLTLKALRGYEKVLTKLQKNLAGDPDASLGSAIEAASLLRNESLPAPKAFRPARENTAFEAAAGIISSQIQAARRHENGIVADIDTEFLHDYRVALRRVRSVLSLFRDAFPSDDTVRLKTRFSALMARTGRVRDLDVYLLERQRYLDLVPETRRQGIDKLFDHFAEMRRSEYEKLAQWMTSRAYQQEIGRLERLFQQRTRLKRGAAAERASPGYAKSLIWKRYIKVCKLAAVIDGAPDEQVHELRIQCKKLRYLMEFFAPAIGIDDVKPLVKSMKRLQNNLGAFNDCSVQQDALELAARDPSLREGQHAVEIAAGIGALVTVLAQQQAAEKARVSENFAAFDCDETRAAFRALFGPEGRTA